MFESKIFVKTNMVADNYVGRCVDGVIYAGGRVLEKPIGEYCDGTIYVSYGLNRHPVGTYKDGTIWSGIGLNRVIVGSYDAVDFYESYGVKPHTTNTHEGHRRRVLPIAVLLRLSFRDIGLPIHRYGLRSEVVITPQREVPHID